MVRVSVDERLARILGKRVDELTSEDKELLRRWWEEHRSRRSISVDLRRRGRVPVYVRTWYRHPGRYDIPGVDTPPMVVEKKATVEKHEKRVGAGVSSGLLPPSLDGVRPFTDRWFARVFMWMMLSPVPNYHSESENYKYMYDRLWQLYRYLVLVRLLMPEEYERLLSYLNDKYKHVVEWIRKNVVHSVKYGEPPVVDNIIVGDVSEMVGSLVRAFNARVMQRIMDRYGLTSNDIRAVFAKLKREGADVGDLMVDLEELLGVLAEAKYGRGRASSVFTRIVHSIYDRLGEALGLSKKDLDLLWKDVRNYYLPRSDYINWYDVGFAMMAQAFIDRIVDAAKRIVEAKYVSATRSELVRNILSMLFNGEGYLKGLETLYHVSTDRPFREDVVDAEYMVLTGYKPLGVLVQEAPNRVVDRAPGIEYVVERLDNGEHRIIIRDTLNNRVVVENKMYRIHNISVGYGYSIRNHVIGGLSARIGDKYKLVYVDDHTLLGETQRRDGWLYFGDDKLVFLSPRIIEVPYSVEGFLRLEGIMHDMHVVDDYDILNMFKKKMTENGVEVPMYPYDAYKYVAKAGELYIAKGRRYYLVVGNRILFEDETLDGLVEKMKKDVTSIDSKYPYYRNNMLELLVKMGYKVSGVPDKETLDKITSIADEVFGRDNYGLKEVGGHVVALSSERDTGIVYGKLTPRDISTVFPLFKDVRPIDISGVRAVFDNLDRYIRAMKEDIKYNEELLREYSGNNIMAKQLRNEIARTKKILSYFEKAEKNGGWLPLSEVPKYLLQSRYDIYVVVGNDNVVGKDRFIDLWWRLKKRYGLPEKLYVASSRDGEGKVLLMVYPEFMVARVIK